MSTKPKVAAVFLSSLLQHHGTTLLRNVLEDKFLTSRTFTLAHWVVTFALLYGTSSLLCVWEAIVWVLSQWPNFLRAAGEGQRPKFLQSVIHGGPLGKGCSKVLELITGYTLIWVTLTYLDPSDVRETRKSSELDFAYAYLQFGPLTYTDRWEVWVGVIVLAALVNGVLFLWSQLLQTRGSHAGVDEMVESSTGRSLSTMEHAQWLLFAFCNAVCEEGCSRGVWRFEFHRAGIGKERWKSNVAQAIGFGVGHYYGIPSGTPGVFLTFVYGLIMGILQDLTGGSLAWPIVAHTLADYFIFAVLARQATMSLSGKKKAKKN